MALGTLAFVLVWLLGVWPPPAWWRDHWPRVTALMRLRSDCRTDARMDRPARSDCPTVRPSALEDIAPVLQRMVIIGEDSRFYFHCGVDPAEIADALGVGHGQGLWGTIATAWRRRDRLRGASTITQQLAKNLYLSTSRNPLRKLKEAVTALRLERALSKERILELYLNVVEWGPGVWGAEAASRAYFGVSARRLTAEQAAALAATLPHPRTSNPTFRPDRMLARRALILARYHGVEVYIPPAEEELDSSLVVPEVEIPPIESLNVRLPEPADTVPDTASQTDSAQSDAQVPRR